MKRVYGNYVNLKDARGAIRDLIKQGYNKDQIRVISYYNVYEQDISDAVDINALEEIRSKFELIKYNNGLWDGDKLDDRDKEVLKEYKNNLESREVVILLEGSPFKEAVPDWDERENEFQED